MLKHFLEAEILMTPKVKQGYLTIFSKTNTNYA
jgi:hypothetical protein